MKEILKDQSFRLAFWITFIFFGVGIAFLYLNLAGLSGLLFLGLPVALGIALGTMKVRRYIILGMLSAMVVVLLSIFIPGLSGFICIVMAAALIAPIVLLVYVIMRLRERYKEVKNTNKLPVLLLPLIPFLIAAPSEHFLNKNKETVVTITTERIFDYTPEQVYDAIKSVDTLDAEKPFLMAFDLPVPTKCILEKEEVGGIRTCYFDKGNLSTGDFGGGTIVEKITQLERGKVLKMDVIDYNLIGRNWLGFKEAIYYFDKVGENKCKLTRITTYTSVLKPRFYWGPMEKLGIEQEHDYVFNNLAKDLRNKYQ
jgi:hypothetical protein